MSKLYVVINTDSLTVTGAFTSLSKAERYIAYDIKRKAYKKHYRALYNIFETNVNPGANV